MREQRNSSVPRPIEDGENIPIAELVEVFSHPPSWPGFPSRNTLLVGSWGIGKTTLLRWLHQDLAANTAVRCVYLSLEDALGSIAGFFGSGPVGGISSTLTEEISNRAAALLAARLWMATSANAYEHRHNETVLPGPIREAILREVGNGIPDLGQTICSCDRNSDLVKDAYARRVPRVFLNRLGSLMQRDGHRLVLLLDRLDNIAWPAVRVVEDLLGQGTTFLSIVATRPAPTGQQGWDSKFSWIPGDHYSVVHLGYQHRTEEWERFLWDSVSWQFKNLMPEVNRFRSTILFLAQGSPRIATSLVGEYLRLKIEHGLGSETAWTSALTKIRDQRIGAAFRLVSALQITPQDFIPAIRDRARAAWGGRLNGPTFVRLDADAESHFAPVEVASGLAVAEELLREGVFSTPSGSIWTPGARLTKFELSPLLVSPDALVIQHSAHEGKEITIPAGKFASIGKRDGGGRPLRSIFVSYRMFNPLDPGFRLPEMVRMEYENRHDLPRTVVVRGDPAGGSIWADEIRRRIKLSSALIVDVQNTRPEVMVEMGFGIGLGKPVVPVVSRADETRQLPEWLRDLYHIASYEDSLGQLIASVEEGILREPTLRLKALTLRLGWFRVPDWCVDAWSASGAVAYGASLPAMSRAILREVVSTSRSSLVESANWDEALSEASRCGLLVLPFDGSPLDSLSHVVAGLFHSRNDRKLGAIRPKLSQLLIILKKNPTVTVARSVLRGRSLEATTSDDAVDKVRGWIDAFQAWRASR